MYLATVFREMPNCWLIRRLLTPEVWSLNIRFIFRMSICLFAMVLFHKKRPLAHYRQIRSKSGSLSSGAGGSISPASYAHFGPAKVVYYVRRFHSLQHNSLQAHFFRFPKTACPMDTDEK